MELNVLKNIREALLAEWERNPSGTIIRELERITRKISEILEGQEVKE